MDVTALSSPRTAPGALLNLASALRTTARVVSRFALRLDGWLARRERAARDYEILSQMSERDLKDIGLASGSIADVARGTWTRDWAR